MCYVGFMGFILIMTYYVSDKICSHSHPYLSLAFCTNYRANWYIYIYIRLVWQDLATHTRVTPAARQASLVKLAQTINRTPAAKAELDKWGLMIDEKLMEVCVVKSY